jgi:hypothetical protein
VDFAVVVNERRLFIGRGWPRLLLEDQCWATQAVGVRSDTCCSCMLTKPSSTADRHSRTGRLIRRQVSTIEKIAATFGPACGLPRWIQFLGPTAMVGWSSLSGSYSTLIPVSPESESASAPPTYVAVFFLVPLVLQS